MMRKMAFSAMIAALYGGLILALAPLSFGPVQFRVAEALTLLPFFMPEAIPGLFIGCLLSNFMGGFGLIDVIFGSAATLLAAWLTHKMPNMYLAAVPPVVVNAVVVGGYLAVITETPVCLSMLYIGASQSVICFGLGIPLCRFLSRTKIFDTTMLSKREKPNGHWVIR
ncbi:MAG: QueT transporter family protein [Synergistaceae bacterium]|nr:QueT transporter family protein [Synergistaceae bacterium]